jgi:spore coat polysaccharide biosynthesis predicted glycosyltransferase SpsG
MNIAFRAYATSQIGTRYFTRCLILAHGLKQRGVAFFNLYTFGD